MLISVFKYWLPMLLLSAGAVWSLHTDLWPLPLTGLLVIVASLMVSEVERSSHQKVAPLIPANDGTCKRRALVVGSGSIGQTVAKHLEATGEYVVVGFVDDEIHEAENKSCLILGHRTSIRSLIHTHAIDEVFLAYAPTWQQHLTEYLAAECPSVSLTVVPSTYEALIKPGNVENLGDIAIIRLLERPNRLTEWGKRCADLMMAVVILLGFGFLMAIIAILIRLTSEGPIFYAQKRVGLNGKLFTLYKFRTMIDNAEAKTGPVWAAGINDPRLTKVGRILRSSRLDELPQLWNVLRGEMSLVGPRPERPEFVEQFQRDIPGYCRRHEVRPGITGLAQVRAGYHTDARDKLRFDLIYVSHQSLWLDLCILVRTLKVVLRPLRSHGDLGRHVGG